MKAPPSHAFIESNETDVVDNFWSRKKEQEQAKSGNVSDLLKWISDVTIKRRKFRKRYRCSHLLAEAVLSNTLRNARQDLALKQEEKRRKAHEFSYQLSIKFAKAEEESHLVENFNNNEQLQADYNSYEENKTRTSRRTNNEMISSKDSEGHDNDYHVQACISSLDDFFSELKSIKV